MNMVMERALNAIGKEERNIVESTFMDGLSESIYCLGSTKPSEILVRNNISYWKMVSPIKGHIDKVYLSSKDKEHMGNSKTYWFINVEFEEMTISMANKIVNLSNQSKNPCVNRGKGKEESTNQKIRSKNESSLTSIIYYSDSFCKL